MSNKVKYGLKNVHYSVITLVNNVPSYGTPVHIPGAVNLTLSPVGEKVRFAADDREDYLRSLILLYGHDTFRLAEDLLDGDVRFFGLEPLGADMQGSAMHQTLLAAYDKLFKA